MYRLEPRHQLSFEVFFSALCGKLSGNNRWTVAARSHYFLVSLTSTVMAVLLDGDNERTHCKRRLLLDAQHGKGSQGRGAYG